MQPQVVKAFLNEILNLRELFLRENSFQVRYNAVHGRGWSDLYLVMVGGLHIGYGAVKGYDEPAHRDDIFEFYLVPAYRRYATLIFGQLVAASAAKFIECQSNDLFLSSMLYQFSTQIVSEVILFGDHSATNLSGQGVIFREKRAADIFFEHKHEPEGNYVLELDGEVVATGGFLLHYNKPFADLYMEVRDDQRQKGFGAYLIQELKKTCYAAGRVPAARCNIDNTASKNTLLKAGMQVAGYMLSGEIEVSRL